MGHSESNDRQRGPLERRRAPAGPRARGESPVKRDQDERNDPAVQPGAVDGAPPRGDEGAARGLRRSGRDD
ncbi:hypothetical protein [Luteimonas sp. FCS-9]|uniref:hypothetical protein n=1 Tax=Luteimonas sp. FCS-9 TaxID=1547516 RepID=UPI00063EABCD|nr:hypothetical protein [Luteimonas sp. FCS-9]KLI97369.1 hypothetical protein WQ56_17145 [Luteimonas sp. FCS-9]